MHNFPRHLDRHGPHRVVTNTTSADLYLQGFTKHWIWLENKNSVFFLKFSCCVGSKKVCVGPCQRSKMKAVLILLRLNYYSLYLPGWLPGWKPEPIIVGQLAGSLGGSSSCSQETQRVDFLLEFRNIISFLFLSFIRHFI